MQKPKFTSTFYGSRPAFSAPSRNVQRLPLVCFRFVNPLIGFLRTTYQRSPYPRLLSARADTHIFHFLYDSFSALHKRFPSIVVYDRRRPLGSRCPVSVDVKSFMSNLLNVPWDLAVGLRSCARRLENFTENVFLSPRFPSLGRSSRKASPWTVHLPCPIYVLRRPGMQTIPWNLLKKKKKRFIIAWTRRLFFRHA